MAVESLGPAERLAVGAIGEPGRRRFYLEITVNDEVHSFLAEKQQIHALASQGLDVLRRHGIETDDTAVEQIVNDGLGITDPGEGGERFRIDEISIALAPSELLTITLTSDGGDDIVSFVVAPEQFRAMAGVGLEAVAAGRPACRWCRLPIDPTGHDCPATNGHRRR